MVLGSGTVVDVGAVVKTVVVGSSVVADVKGGGVEVPGIVGAGAVTVVEVGVKGIVVEARVVGEGGEEVEVAVLTSVGTVEGGARVTIVVTVV